MERPFVIAVQFWNQPGHPPPRNIFLIPPGVGAGTAGQGAGLVCCARAANGQDWASLPPLLDAFKRSQTQDGRQEMI